MIRTSCPFLVSCCRRDAIRLETPSTAGGMEWLYIATFILPPPEQRNAVFLGMFEQKYGGANLPSDSSSSPLICPYAHHKSVHWSTVAGGAAVGENVRRKKSQGNSMGAGDELTTQQKKLDVPRTAISVGGDCCMTADRIKYSYYNTHHGSSTTCRVLAFWPLSAVTEHPLSASVDCINNEHAVKEKGLPMIAVAA